MKRFLSFQARSPLKVCVVGSGPAGFYLAQHLLKDPRIHVDMLERLPVPFGLVRYGVAPDHPDVKNVDATFTKTAQNPRFRFFGNVDFGKDVSYSSLKSLYPAVVLAYGAASSKKLNVPGENLSNVIPGKDFVGFYNGLPQNQNLKIDLTRSESAVVVGVGNVALDIARILLSPIDTLKTTDISQPALEALSGSRIKRVHIVGRRGPLDVSFTIKELREMLHIPGVRPLFENKSLYDRASSVVPNLQRPKKRLIELLLKSALQSETLDARGSDKSWVLKLLRHPREIHSDDNNYPKSMSFNVNEFVEESMTTNQKIRPTDEIDQINCGLVITSIGYKSIPPPKDSGIPFDEIKGIIPNVDGKVCEGLYVAGWLGTGPKGVIVNTMTEAFNVGRTIVKDFDEGLLFLRNSSQDLSDELVNSSLVTSWKDWERIDSLERSGVVKKPREKFVSISSMIDAIKKR